MCVIMWRPAGKKISEEDLVAAGQVNRDGVGVMFAKDGKMHIQRSMDTKDVLKFMENVPDDIDCAIHYRMGTHGQLSQQNVHPFRVSKGLYLMHNGILPYNDKENVLSDTAIFARDIFGPLVDRDPDNPLETWRHTSMLTALNALTGTSNKILMLDANGYSFIANEKGGQWIDGVWYSNRNFVYRKTTTTTYSPTTTTHGYGSHSWKGGVYQGADESKSTSAISAADERYKASGYPDAEDDAFYNEWIMRESVDHDATEDNKRNAISEAEAIFNSDFADLVDHDELADFLLKDYGYDLRNNKPLIVPV